MCSTYVLLMFYLCSTYVLLKMCSIRDNQRISTDVIMLCCSVLCQHMSTCVVLCNIPMCYDVSYCNNSSHHTSTHPCLIADGTQSLQHHYPSEHPVTLLQCFQKKSQDTSLSELLCKLILIVFILFVLYLCFYNVYLL